MAAPKYAVGIEGVSPSACSRAAMLSRAFSNAARMEGAAGNASRMNASPKLVRSRDSGSTRERYDLGRFREVIGNERIQVDGHPDSLRPRVRTNHRAGSNSAAHTTATYRIDEVKTHVRRRRNTPTTNIVPKTTSPILRHSGRAIQFARARCASWRCA